MTAAQIIIPAHNEAHWIGDCLKSLLTQEISGAAHVIVVANGCTDDTARKAAHLAPDFARNGWQLTVADLPAGGKVGALNHGDGLAGAGPRVYLDADIRMQPGLLGGIIDALGCAAPRYAGGRLRVSQSPSKLSNIYARFWQKLPFLTQDVTGAGLFAVNEAGRARWNEFPQIISDDTYVRLHFAPAERVLVDIPYDWPIAAGAANLIKVRRRQDNGVSEIARLYPALLENQGHDRPGRGELLGIARKDPVGFGVYAAIALAVRMGRNKTNWARGR